MDEPVRNVTIRGITLTGTRPTYLDPHGLPSAGDWGMARLAAIHAKGTVGLLIESCLFQRLDGNAILFDGYNRESVVTKNEIFLIGSSGIVLWGYEHYGDGTGGEQPRGTVVTSNFCHEIGSAEVISFSRYLVILIFHRHSHQDAYVVLIAALLHHTHRCAYPSGIYQKQSSCYFHAVSAQSTIRNNLFFNGPRAMVNFNDGFGGGHDLGSNLIFNACRLHTHTPPPPPPIFMCMHEPCHCLSDPWDRLTLTLTLTLSDPRDAAAEKARITALSILGDDSLTSQTSLMMAFRAVSRSILGCITTSSSPTTLRTAAATTTTTGARGTWSKITSVSTAA